MLDFKVKWYNFISMPKTVITMALLIKVPYILVHVETFSLLSSENET